MYNNFVTDEIISENRRGFMGFFESIIFYSCEFVVIVGVAIAGIFVGKKLRDRKTKKSSAEEKNEVTIN